MWPGSRWASGTWPPALGLTELETVQTVEEMQRQYDLERQGA